MEETNLVALTILQQLGGREFLLLTGCTVIPDGNTLRIHLTDNQSGANRMDISPNDTDTYDMTLYHYQPHRCRINKTTGKITEYAEKILVIEQMEGLYCDMLKDNFEYITGLYVSLFPRQ